MKFTTRLCVMVAALAGPILADDLPVLAFWQFNASDPYADSSGSGNTITTHSRPVDCGGNFARFDQGTSGQFGRSINLSSYSAVTIEMFVRLDTYRNGQMIFFTHYGWNGAGTGFFGMHGGANDKGDVGQCVATWFKNSSSTATVAREVEKSDGAVLSDMKWHHVALVMDASSDDASVVDEMKLYIDGVLQTTSTGTGHHTKSFGSASFLLGSVGSGNAAGYRTTLCPRTFDFFGDIDDVRITAAALAPEQFLTAPTVVETECPDGTVEWTGGAAPAAGADVHVPGSAAIVLEGATPIFNSITVDGTLIFNSSNNCLRADDVRVGTSGRLQAGPPFGGNTAVSNRVWVVCDTFTLEKGGRINAIGSGFWGGNDAHSAAGPGTGNGSGQDNRAGAGSHGSFSTTSPMGKAPYGSAEWPETAGSGGWMFTTDIAGSNGGGVVRIDATGLVTIDGEVCANSPDQPSYINYGRSAAGAGGSILINCSHIAGSGRLSAKGGTSSGAEWSENVNNRQSSPGAGGRIAVHYDPQEQTYAEAKDLVFEVQAGKSRPCGYSFAETGFWMYAGAGTLWFTDETLIGAENLSNLRGRLVNAHEVSFPGDVVVSNWVGFATDGARITVGGNLVVTDADGRLEIGSVDQISSDANIQRKSYVSAAASLLQVAGDMIVTNAARFDLYAAATNAAQKVGAQVNVGGLLAVTTNSYVYPFTDPVNGGAPAFTAKDFRVDLGGTFGIVGGGFTGRRGGNGYGPGYGTSVYGAGHGGFGGRVVTWDGDVATTNTTVYGKIYGDAVRPTLAGSGGGHGWTGQNGGGVGGGVLHIVVSNSMDIAGAVVADGSSPQGYANGSSGGAGGSILLETKTLSIASTARITAKGGDSGTTAQNANKYTSGGGGGRIAVWSGKAIYEPSWRKSRYTVSEEVPVEWSGVFDVSGGAARLSTAAFAGEDGTLRFISTRGVGGLFIGLY